MTEMQQIVNWLKKLSMSEYAESAENDIDIAVLLDLTDQHLKESLPAGARELPSSSEPSVAGARL